MSHLTLVPGNASIYSSDRTVLKPNTDEQHEVLAAFTAYCNERMLSPLDAIGSLMSNALDVSRTITITDQNIRAIALGTTRR